MLGQKCMLGAGGNSRYLDEEQHGQNEYVERGRAALPEAVQDITERLTRILEATRFVCLCTSACTIKSSVLFFTPCTAIIMGSSHTLSPSFPKTMPRAFTFTVPTSLPTLCHSPYLHPSHLPPAANYQI